MPLAGNSASHIAHRSKGVTVVGTSGGRTDPGWGSVIGGALALLLIVGLIVVGLVAWYQSSNSRACKDCRDELAYEQSIGLTPDPGSVCVC